MANSDRTMELVERARRGDGGAFETLLTRSRPRVEAFIERRIRAELRGQLDAKELAGETLSRAFESLSRFTGEDEDAWFAWLAGIARHVVLKEVERVRHRPALELDRDVSADAPSPSRAQRREERFERLAAALDGLSPDYREVIRLCRLEGLRIREAAARLGRSPEAVKMLLSRALRELKGKFGDTQSLGLPPRRLGEGGGGDER